MTADREARAIIRDAAKYNESLTKGSDQSSDNNRD